MNFLWNKLIQWFDRISSFFMGRIWARVVWVLGGVSVWDTFDLDHSLAEWMLPRLRLYRKVDTISPTHAAPPGLTDERWNEVLDEIEFELSKLEIGNDLRNVYDFSLLGKHLTDLWW